MIAYIKGNLTETGDGYVIVEVNGVGFHIVASASTIAAVNGKTDVKLHTRLLVREDAMSLVGFSNKEDLRVFELLTGVSGVGTKAALGLQSHMSASQIMLAIVTEDTAALSRAPGVGKKLAQRIALELKDKVKAGDGVADMVGNPQQSIGAMAGGGPRQDAVEALLSLGYGRSESVRAVMETAQPDMAVEDMIRLALKKLAAF